MHIIYSISIITKSSVGQHSSRITFIHIFIANKKVLEMPGSNLWTRFQANAFTTKENINCLEDSSFHMVQRKNSASFHLSYHKVGGVWELKLIGLKPKNFSVTTNHFGFFNAILFCLLQWPLGVLREWMYCVDEEMGLQKPGRCLAMRVFSLCILGKSFSIFWVSQNWLLPKDC